MKSVIDYYSIFDEWGRLDREPIEFMINWHYMKQYLPPSGKVLDNGGGPGKYAMELAKLGYQVTLSDLTPKLVSAAEAKAVELGVRDHFDGFHVLNATRLDGIADAAYDASLMLGPLYHLQQEDERVSALNELFRVTKKGGIVFGAFQTRIKMLLTSLQYPQHWTPNDNMDSINQFIQMGIFNHSDEGRFTGAYYFAVEEIKPFMENGGFETLELIGSSNLAALLTKEQKQYWADRGTGEYDQLLELLIRTAKDPSLLGISSHLLYIGTKK
jgi:ubiquinone/menaquinone biosynthesis C-methylase UbiE